jgi:hypothetical protein
MRYIGIIILLVFCLTLLLLTGCVVNTVISETTSGNLENQENTEEPVKWSDLGINLFETENTSEFDGNVDILLANGFTELRMYSDWYNWDTDTALKSAVVSAITKGAQVILVVQSGGRTLTSSNWDDYADAVLDAAQWAQDNGVYEFQLGNEEEMHNDDTTLTDAQVRDNFKSVATDAQEIFTRGNISYSCSARSIDIDSWIAIGKEDIDILASNVYMGGEGYYNNGWETLITNLVNAFGADGTYLTEFGPSWTSLDDYSTDEAEQTAAVAEMIEYIKASGMTRALFFCYEDPTWLSGDIFGARKDDGTYRLLWNQALLSIGPVKSITVPTKTTTISLPDTIALLPK